MKLLLQNGSEGGSYGFDFGGTYDQIKSNELISFTIGDGRKVEVSFIAKGDATEVTEVFEAEDENSIELQRSGWQSILIILKNMQSLVI